MSVNSCTVDVFAGKQRIGTVFRCVLVPPGPCLFGTLYRCWWSLCWCDGEFCV